MMKKHLLSLAACLAFLVIALASTVNKIHNNAFNYSNKVEDGTEKGNFLVKTDGTRVYGEKITWKSGALVKDQVKIDEQKFSFNEIKGYMSKNVYYANHGGQFMQRIVHGKINVYLQYTDVTQTTTDSRGNMQTRTSMGAIHYAQRGRMDPG